ncbi:MAG: aconitate hydratase [Nitrospinales bacterium]|jgi:aconitate hydratase
MLMELGPIEKLYQSYAKILDAARKNLGRDLTVVEKNIFAHLPADTDYSKLERGVSDIYLSPDRVAMQDATAQMAILQFMSAKMPKVAVPTTVHCDHLIQASNGATADLKAAEETNKEVYDFLRSAAMKYGMGFWKPGSGIIHQVVYENYAVPGTMIIGTDSHTPNAGGMGTIAIGVGGADAVDVMTGQPFMTKMPKLVGIRLKGELSGWTASKDIILKVATMLTVKGGTGKIVEYFGEGARSLSATGKGTVTNMGAEIGATTSTFGYDENMLPYLRATDRGAIADLCEQYAEHLQSDPSVQNDPEKYYDEYYEIDLSTLEPHIVGPHTPDLGRPVSAMSSEVDEKGYAEPISAALIGSCTNSSYEDMTRSISLVRQAKKAGVSMKTSLLVTPGSETIYQTIIRDGILKEFEDAGATVLANACGPCIGQWKRDDIKKGDKNSILTSYNRNFAKRNDGNPETLGFISSPELVVAMAYGGSMKFNPMTDALKDKDGNDFKFEPPAGEVLPSNGYTPQDAGFELPTNTGEVVISPTSERLAFLEPFPEMDPVKDYQDLPVLFKAKGKCTTDHISQAGPWLKFRGHLDNISNNMFLGANNAFHPDTGVGNNPVTGEENQELNKIARNLKDSGLGWVAFGEENIGEGSSREHAAMEPRHMGCRAFVATSYARIFEANLKKQAVLAFTFADKADYDKIQAKDKISFAGLDSIAPGTSVTMTVKHEDGSSDSVQLNHTLNADQVKWFKFGSALNYVGSQK